MAPAYPVGHESGGGGVAEPFKNLINPGGIRAIGEAIRGVEPSFPLDSFLEAACAGLEPMELKARVRHVAAALRAALPEPWPQAVALLVKALPPALPTEEGVTGGMVLWPVLQVVEDFGAQDPAHSLPALREMTRRFSAEFAIRPLLKRHPDAAWAALAEWSTDADLHVRRLVSEGSRPRLPWGERLDADPRALPLLDRLVDDPSPYVRRSVANHLGDLAKIDPEGALSIASRWMGQQPARRDLVRHGLRDLLKKGHPGALALLGHAPVGVEVVDLRAPDVRVGEPLEVSARIRAAEAAHLRVDLVWMWPGARGGWSSKTFRGGDRELAAGEWWDFRGRLSTRPVSTRPTRPGPQRLVLRVMGQDFGPISWNLVP